MAQKELRGGYTTGASAAAGMKAALLALLQDEYVSTVSVLNPQGVALELPINDVRVLSPHSAQAIVIKDGGDDPDVTHGAQIITTIELTTDDGLQFRGGHGVGTVTKSGLALEPGEPAINPGPRTMMAQVYEEFRETIKSINEIKRIKGRETAEGIKASKGVDMVEGGYKGLLVTVSVPTGLELAKKTLNGTLGIEGGISIIGTTGIVKPMSEEGFKNSLIPHLQVMKASGYKTAVLVPGRIGRDLGEKQLGIPAEQMAETSNFIGFMLEQAVQIGFKRILLIGHIGKIVKLASGSFHTHNRMSDGRIETLVAYAALEGASQAVAQEIMDCQTTEAVHTILEREGLTAVYQRVADRAALRSARYISGDADVGVIIANLDGTILACDAQATQFLREEGWHCSM